ncbi:hypothetical protein ACLKA6_000519 [Drosophila palustris]
MAKKPKVCIIGAESWGSAISTAVCKNVLNGEFDKRVHIYVYDELVRSSYLSEVMNERHENIKYLPGIKLDDNLIAVNDLVEAAKEADILIFATSHSFLKPYCNILAGKMKSSAYAVSLIKGLDHIRDGEIDLYSHAISNQLKIPCYSVMSANSAMEMAQGKLCEITIGCNNAAHAQQLTNLFQTENCKVFSIDDVDGVELCNTLKDLVALSAGFIDGLRLGDNARVACLHLGLKEMMRFIKAFNPTTKLSTFFESCGVANSVASSYADKNVTFAKSFVTTRKTVQEIEANLLNGRKLLGPVIAGEVHAYLERAKLQSEYPLFTILHRICQNEVPPDAILETLRNHPDFSNCSITRLQKEEYSMPISDTDSVLENLDDTVPEHSSISLDNAISRHSIANPFESFNEKEAEFLEPFQQYFKIPNTNMELNEFLEKCQKSSMTAIAAIDDPNPNDGHVEYSFEIESAADKPEIYLKLKDITTNPITDEIDQERETNPSICNAVGSANLISELPKDSTEFLSMKGGQSAEMSASASGSNKSNAGKPSPLVGLTNIIERHVRPYNEKFKALKVRVKLTNDDQKSKDKKSTINKEINQSSVGNSATLLDAKPVDSEPLEEIPGKRTKINVNAKEEVLYDKDSEYSMRLLGDDPHVMKLIDMIRIKEELNQEQEVKEVKKVEETKDIKITSTELDQSNENVFPINQGGYTVDYLKVVHNSYRLDHSQNDQLQDEDSKNTTSTVSESSDKKSTETLEFNNQEHIDDPGLELRGTDMDQVGLEDQQKLKMAQEFLDKQATLIKNLVMETASSDNNLNNLNSEAKKEPNLSCAKLEDPKFWLDYPKKAEMHESLLEPVEQSRKQTHKDQSNVERQQKLEVKEVLGQDDHESIMRDEKPQVLPEDHHHDKTLRVETKAVESHNDFDRILSNESQNDFDKILTTNENRSGDEETEGKPKLMDDQHSLGLAQKKNQTHGLEDPNLRFYHAKNDGEQGPEWNWLLDEDNSEQRSKQKTILSENQDQDQAVPISDEDKSEVPKSKQKTVLTETQDQDTPPISDEDKAEVPKSSKNKSRLTLRRKKIEDLALKEDHHHEKYASASLSSSVPSLPMDSQHKESSNSQFIEALIEKTMAEQIISEESEAMSRKKKNDKHENRVELEEFAEEDLLYKEMKTPMSEEMLLDEEASYKAILDEDAKFSSSHERERMEQEEFVEGKYELKKPETETETETQLSTLMSRGQTKERAVNYKGTNPYIDQMNILPESTDITSAMANDTESERRMRKRTVLRPSFHPPINPRVRIPRPPFDVRDHEYHTVNYRPPPDLLRHAALPKRRLPLPVAYNQAKQVSVSVSASNVAKLPRPAMRLPSSVMRSSVLAVEVGLFAAFFTRYSK